jgi:hypothetical protein
MTKGGEKEAAREARLELVKRLPHGHTGGDGHKPVMLGMLVLSYQGGNWLLIMQDNG